MIVHVEWERDTTNFAVHTFQKGDKEYCLYLPHAILKPRNLREKAFEAIVSLRTTPNNARLRIQALEKELAEYKRRINAIRGLV